MSKTRRIQEADQGAPSDITRIDPVTSLPVPEESGWTSVLKAFNPFGFIGEVYARTLSYKLEVRRLEAEERRIGEQARMLNSAIDKTYTIKMEELSQRRLALERTFDAVQQQLEQMHIERMTVLAMAQRASDCMLEKGRSLEEMTCFRLMATELVGQVTVFGDKANESLRTLVAALPAVASPKGLLPGGRQ
ncbi:MAG TPA: hypothetical protein PK668_20980 [Myxococcota bacterium]|nr:hypothetical protein [Myxococcota bacterium]HRY96613.1 hypothetical protein [Myxococcota bacterium]